MVNPIKYYRHISGPRRKIIGEVWDSDRRGYSLLECGHAVPSRYKRAGVFMSAGRMCLLCNKYGPPEEKIQEFGFLEKVVIKQALLEGKRRRACFYFLERGLEIPKKLKRPRFHMALFDDPDKVVPPP